MAANEITQDDLIKFKVSLIEELKKYFLEKKEYQTTQDELTEYKVSIIEEIKTFFAKKDDKSFTKWLKSHQVQRLLGISASTLQRFREKGMIPYSKVGKVLFYSQEDLNTILQENKRNKK